MYRNKYTTRIEWFGWTCTVLAIGFIVYVNIAQKKVVKENNTYKPDSHITDTMRIESDHIIYHEWDSVMDSVDMDCGSEYHGREGESEYGEYEYSKWMEQQ
jgi:hypothetical protein